jgi:hypothetical protein
MLKFIVLIVTIQIFYAGGVTMLAYSLPTAQLNHLDFDDTYQSISNDLDIDNIADTIQTNVRSQLNIPVVDISALVFFSGNIIIDMIINFWTAVPSMITILISSYFTYFPVDAYIQSYIKLVVYVFITILYTVGFLQFILSIRSGGAGRSIV